MKTVKISTDNRVSVIEVDFNDFHSIQQAVGGCFETVHTRQMFQYFKQPISMRVDEDGHYKKLPYNRLGCFFYETTAHGWPILGDFILAIPEGENFYGLPYAEEMKKQLLRDFNFLEEGDDNGSV